MTEIVDGDTLDINNVMVRLALVNTLKAKNVLADLTMKAIWYKTGFQPWITGE